METLSHITGLLALALTTSSYAFKADQTLRTVNFTACLFWALHMATLGAWSSFAMVVLAIFMIGSSLFDREEWALKLWIANLLVIPATILSAMAGLVSGAALLPVLGGFFINTGVVRFSGIALTLFIGAGELMWLINGFVIGSNFAIINNSLGLGVLTYRLWKLQKERQAYNDALDTI